MTDFTDILPADLLPEAVREYAKEYYDGLDGMVWEDEADAAIAAALELARSLMRCTTCARLADLNCDDCSYISGPPDTNPPSGWQHFKEA